MLNNIPSILSPELMKTLMEMGHGDEIVIADGNFPTGDVAKRLIRCDGNGVPKLLEAILRFFPLDTFVEMPVSFMAVVPGDNYTPEIQDEYRKIITEKNGSTNVEMLDRFAFYERASKAYAIVATSEMARYANIILKKGIILPDGR